MARSKSRESHTISLAKRFQYEFAPATWRKGFVSFGAGRAAIVYRDGLLVLAEVEGLPDEHYQIGLYIRPENDTWEALLWLHMP